MMTEDEKEKARLFLPDLRRSPTSSSRGPAVEEMTSNESVSSNSISNFKWGATNRRSRTQFRGQGDTEISAPALIGSSDKGISGLSAGTSKEKKGTEETRSAQNTGGPLSLNIIDGVTSGSPVPSAVTPNYSKHDSTDLGLISSSSSPVTSAQRPLPSSSVGSNSRESKKRDTALHPLIFKEAGLPDNTLLTYKLKNGEALLQGYKQGAGIVCNCCNQEVSPSEFEKHAGMGKRRQPYQNIYTSQGLTLHDVALQLHHLNLNSNGFSNASVSSFSDYPNLTSSGCGKEPSVSGPIVPLKRTLQERVVQTESCYFCGYGHTELGKIDPNMIVFCNQCERPCHVKCYNSRVVKKKIGIWKQSKLHCRRKNREGEKDFRGMYCVVLTASTHVVSAAILKVRVEHAAELVLIATRSECRKKGYFRLLLESIETNLRACNVSLLMAPVDPEMAQIWSDKLGFTILSADENKSMLESHPLVMFKNLVLVQKPLA
ncbi:Increased DNA methylation 1 [Zea mays]|uniref:Increased DNA methylation 1 n=1 Tax=Zea mays TaxID=4577 RepID=A0A317YBE5_MAIZE|nr:Increased DNA methylation 1 [Zea mays]